MKPVWLGIVLFLVYGLFSMKSHAAEEPLIKKPGNVPGSASGLHPDPEQTSLFSAS